MSTRRGFLKLLGASPIAVKKAAEVAVAELSSMSVSGLGGPPPPTGPYFGHALRSADHPVPKLSPQNAIKLALKIPGLRREIESHFWETNRYVGHLDPDIASKQSFSLAAKITFQRQRNVQYAIDNCGDGWGQDSFWHGIMDRARNWMGG